MDRPRDAYRLDLSQSPPLSRDELDRIEEKSAKFAMAELARLARLDRLQREAAKAAAAAMTPEERADAAIRRLLSGGHLQVRTGRHQTD